MRLNRLRAGESLAGLGAVALLVLLFFDWVRPEASLLRQPGADIPAALQAPPTGWYGAFVDANAQTGWHGLGWLMVAVLLLAVIAALTLVVLTVTQEPSAWPSAPQSSPRRSASSRRSPCSSA